MSSSAVSKSRLEDGTAVNLTVVSLPDGDVHVDVNFHRGFQDPRNKEAVDLARPAMAEFDSDYKRITSILEVINSSKKVG